MTDDSTYSTSLGSADERLRVARSSGEDLGSPTWMLRASAAAVVASVTLFTLGSGLGANLAGYALGSLVAFTFVALFRRASITRFLETGTSATSRTNLAAAALLVLGLVCASVHAYLIARHYA